MTKATKNLCVKLREYTDNNGQPKAQWQKIGTVMQGDKGSFLLLDRHINLAGLPFKEGSTSVMVSVFDIEDKNQSSNTQAASTQAKFEEDDNIPF